MKTFLNVLYRRILYKIPLKLLLILLAVFGLLFAVSKADNITLYDGLDNTYTTTNVFVNPLYNTSTDDIYLLCITNNSTSKLDIRQGAHHIIMDWGDYPPFCLGVNNTLQDLSVIVNGSQSYSAYNVSYIKASNFNSQNCQSEYNLIPINEIDNAYCESNNLCSSSSNPSDCPNVGVSNLFINDIFHPGAYNVIMNIPEEISRDYAYTNSGYNFNLDIEGYNVDYEKMQEIIDVQNYKPNSEEFSSIVSSIVPLFVPGLCIILLLYFIFRFIKKIF